MKCLDCSFTGLKDINGKNIYEGDRVVVYPENYEMEKIKEGIYFVDKTKPLPLQDILLFKGIVIWSAPEFRVKVDDFCNPRGVASISMNGYWFEIIQN